MKANMATKKKAKKSARQTAWEKKMDALIAERQLEIKAHERAFRKETGLKLPAGTQYDKDSASWRKRSGHAGGKTIAKQLEHIKSLGWKKAKDSNGNTPDGSNFWGGSDYVDPTGKWCFSTHTHIGVTAYENSYSIEVKRVPPSAT